MPFPSQLAVDQSSTDSTVHLNWIAAADSGFTEVVVRRRTVQPPVLITDGVEVTTTAMNSIFDSGNHCNELGMNKS